MKSYFNDHVCPEEELGDLLFNEDETADGLDEKITGMDNETFTQFAKAL